MDASGLFEVMLSRRSIRKYTGEKIPDETYEKIIKAGLCAPTSKNKKPEEFILVRDKEKLEALSKAKALFGTFIKDADGAVVIIADADKSDVWQVDAALSGMNMMLMAASLGIGCCWAQMGKGRTNADGVESDIVIRTLLGIPDNYGVLCVLSFGVPKDTPHAHTEEGLDLTKIHVERF